jgi:hypothetical protein
LLAPGGTLAIVGSVQGATAMTADFDLALRSTEGCAPLPRLNELKKQLLAAGFREVNTTKLIPTEPFYGITAM